MKGTALHKKSFKFFRVSLPKHAVLIIVGLMFLAPFAWLVVTSIETNNEIFSTHPVWFPRVIRWSNYPLAIKNFPFVQYTLNTFYVCGISMIVSLLTCPIVAYAVSRMKFPGRNLLFYIMVGTMILPSQVTMVPLYITFEKLGLINTYWPLILPANFANAYYIFLLRQFFLTIPYDISEAAKIDGASEFRTFLTIIIPLSRPALYTVALFTFLSMWGDFLGPLIYLNNPNKWTLSLGLQSFMTDHSVQWGLLMAASTLFTVPIIVLYFFVQRKFIQGISLTGLK